MGIDLRLIATPLYKVVENAAKYSHYEYILNEIREPGSLGQELQWAQDDQDDARVLKLKDVIKEWYELIHVYPGLNTKPYQFYSRYQGYSTLNFLLSKHCNAVGQPIFHFFEGKVPPADTSDRYARHLEIEEVLKISHVLSATSFSELMKQYDYEEVKKNAYKPTSPDHLDYLEEEYQELVSFFEHAAALTAYVIIDMY